MNPQGDTYHDIRGSLWHRWDLHFHTPSSFDYEDKSAKLGNISGLSDDFSSGFSEASPQFSMSYSFSPKQMTYISAARGYKACGFNPAPTGVPAAARTESYGAEHM